MYTWSAYVYLESLHLIRSSISETINKRCTRWINMDFIQRTFGKLDSSRETSDRAVFERRTPFLRDVRFNPRENQDSNRKEERREGRKERRLGKGRNGGWIDAYLYDEHESFEHNRATERQRVGWRSKRIRIPEGGDDISLQRAASTNAWNTYVRTISHTFTHMKNTPSAVRLTRQKTNCPIEKRFTVSRVRVLILSSADCALLPSALLCSAPLASLSPSLCLS